MAYKMKGFSGFKASPVKQKVDPDAPGTPGTPGYEPTVKRSDLDEKGKAIWDAHKAKKENDKEQKRIKEIHDKYKKSLNPNAKKLAKSPAKQEGPIPKKNIKLQKGEMDGTYIYDGQDKNERIIDLEERAGFLTDNDITNDGSKEDNQRIKTAKKLQHEADIIRNRKSAKKKKK
tara:strand:+ start:90 stop:611 length:522 start_codon:yes stop_codon:yes gene_type:complete